VDVTDGPSTVPISSADGQRMRVVSVARNGRLLVVGYPLAEIDARNRTLTVDAALLYGLVCVVLGAVTWQVLRLGVRPLDLMARWADSVAAGEDTAPSPDFTPGTEADRLARAFRTTIDAKDRAVGELEAFVAETSHELLNPLSTITGYAQLYLAGKITDPAATHDAVDRIDQEARRIGRAVDGLAQLSLTRTLPMGTAQDIDVSMLVADLCLDLTLIHPDRPVRVDIDPALMVAGDPDLVVQVVGALLRNALEHTPATAPLTVTVHPASGPGNVPVVRIEVADDGPGIAPHHQPLLFERFYRVEPSTGSSPGGLGLGLAIVASITAAMNGRCGVDSGPGGSTFWLEFPRVVADAR
jgi:two-component system OmpR family sensor kinase